MAIESFIANSADIKDLGLGVSFKVQEDGRIWSAFVIRFEGKALCYLDACAHVGLRLNRDTNQFFGDKTEYLLCRSHGAIYDAASGLCTDGPCVGFSLISLTISEREGCIYYKDDIYQRVN